MVGRDDRLEGVELSLDILIDVICEDSPESTELRDPRVEDREGDDVSVEPLELRR